MIKTFLIPALAGLAVLSAPSAALAGTAQGQTNTVVVSSHGLDLTTDAGAAELQKRIRSATFRACMYGEKGQLIGAQEQFACARNSQNEARPQVAQKIASARFGG